METAYSSDQVDQRIVDFDAVNTINTFPFLTETDVKLTLDSIHDGHGTATYPSSADVGPDCIHQIWMQGEEHLRRSRPRFFAHLMEFRALHRHHIFWDESMIVALIRDKYAGLLSTYNNYECWIMRVDLAKYIILYEYGGFYCDMDSRCKRNFNGLTLMTSSNKVLLAVIVDDKRTKLYKRNFVNNHFFYVPCAHHPFMQLMLQQAPNVAKRRHLEPMILYVLRVTGPGFLMNCINKYRKKVQNETKARNKKLKIKNPWPICGSLQKEDVISIVRSDVLNNYFVHESANTWLDKQWLDQKDKRNALGITASTILVVGATCLLASVLL